MIKLMTYIGASLVAQLVKNLPAMQETWVRSLGWEDPLEKGDRIPKSMSLLHFKSQLPHCLCLHNFALPVALLHHESTAVPCVKLDSPGDV